MPNGIPTIQEYKPTFDISETFAVDLSDKKIGQRLQTIINYTVIEKTKTFTILRVDSIYLLPSSRRKY